MGRAISFRFSSPYNTFDLVSDEAGTQWILGFNLPVHYKVVA